MSNQVTIQHAKKFNFENKLILVSFHSFLIYCLKNFMTQEFVKKTYIYYISNNKSYKKQIEQANTRR